MIHALLLLALAAPLSVETFWSLLDKPRSFVDSIAHAQHWHTQQVFTHHQAELRVYDGVDLSGILCEGTLQVFSFGDTVQYLMWYADSGESCSERFVKAAQLTSAFTRIIGSPPKDTLTSSYVSEYEWGADQVYLNILAYPSGWRRARPLRIAAASNLLAFTGVMMLEQAKVWSAEGLSDSIIDEKLGVLFDRLK